MAGGEEVCRVLNAREAKWLAFEVIMELVRAGKIEAPTRCEAYTSEGRVLVYDLGR